MRQSREPSMQESARSRPALGRAAGCVLQLAGAAVILAVLTLAFGAVANLGRVLDLDSLPDPSTWPALALSLVFLLLTPSLIWLGVRLFRREGGSFPVGAAWRPRRLGLAAGRALQRRPLLGTLIRYLGLGLSILAAIILMVVVGGDQVLLDRALDGLVSQVSLPDTWQGRGLVILLAVILVPGGLLLLGALNALGQRAGLFGAKLAAPRAEDVLAKDSRPPVLYLRSFPDDATAARTSRDARPIPYTGQVPPEKAASLVADQWRAAFRQSIPGWPAGRTEEQQIAAVLNEIGPVVAVGRPGERLPELGAARLYVGDAWQDAIAELVRRARLVVLRAGSSPGLWWEFQYVIQHAPPEKVLLLVPYDQVEYEAFSRRANTLFPHPLPPYQGLRRSRNSLTGLVYFDRQWRPHFQELRVPRWLATSFPAEFKWSLEPVFAQLGIPVRRPRLEELRGTLVSLGLAAFLLLFLLLMLVWIVEGLFPGALPFS